MTSAQKQQLKHIVIAWIDGRERWANATDYEFGMALIRSSCKRMEELGLCVFADEPFTIDVDTIYLANQDMQPVYRLTNDPLAVALMTAGQMLTHGAVQRPLIEQEAAS